MSLISKHDGMNTISCRAMISNFRISSIFVSISERNVSIIDEYLFQICEIGFVLNFSATKQGTFSFIERDFVVATCSNK